MINPFDNAMQQLDNAAKVRKFPADFLAQLRVPEREISFSIPVKMDDGEMKVFEGYRVQYSSARGPYKGGIRYHQDTEINEVKALAFWMALKCAVVNIPMGGGKGGITVDPSTISKTELEALSRGWVRRMADMIGPKKDVPAPDVNTTPEIMGWMVDEYAKITHDTTGAVITGKPLDKGGSEGRGPATGLGGFYVFEALRERVGLPPRVSVVIQGFGNVGGNAARIFAEHGHKVLAVSDHTGGIYNEQGLDISALLEHAKTNGNIKGFSGGTVIENSALLELACDVLVPAALENQITKDNAANIKAKVILELANGPTTPEADAVFLAKGLPVIPDILANAGGVTVSYFEWDQNLKGEHWTEVDVFSKLQKIMAAEADAVYNQAQVLKTDLRTAAFVVALERLAGAMGYTLDPVSK